MGSLSQPRLNIFTVGNMRVMICLSQGGLRSLSASSYKYIYTDGSKVEEKVAAAAVTDSEIFVYCLADHSSIFTAEVKAISLALDHIKKTNNTRYIIFSDSLSCLQAFLQASPKNPWVVTPVNEERPVSWDNRSTATILLLGLL